MSIRQRLNAPEKKTPERTPAKSTATELEVLRQAKRWRQLLALSAGLALVLATVIIRMSPNSVRKAGYEDAPARSDLSEPGGTVVVVGAGLAGLSAALSALDSGARQVVVVEKSERIGGNSAKATSGINSVNEAGSDLPEAFVLDTLKAGHEVNDVDLVARMAHESRGALQWLKSFDLDLEDSTRLGGHTVPRTWRLPELADGRPRPVGFNIMRRLKEALTSAAYEERVKVVLNASVRGLSTGLDGSVTGVTAEKPEGVETFSGVAVVLATGGYCASSELLQEHAPQFATLPSTNGPWATGDGIYLGSAVGAVTRDLEHVQVHPTSFLNGGDPSADSNILAPEALRGCGGVLLDTLGRRFANELATRDVLSQSILERGFDASSYVRGRPSIFGNPEQSNQLQRSRKAALLVLSAAMVQKFGMAAAGFYASKGLLFRFSNVSQASGEMFDAGNELQEELRNYATRGLRSEPDQFGKDSFPLAESFSADGELWIGIITPALHYSMGGLTVSPSAEVLAVGQGGGSHRAISGLFGAGEVTGGMHGANRLAGNSLLECVVMGRIAGERAASSPLADAVPALLPDAWTKVKVRQMKDVVEGGERTAKLITVELPSVRHELEFDRGERVVLRTESHAPIALPPLWTTRGAITLVTPPDLPGVVIGATVDVLGPVRSNHLALEEIGAAHIALVVSGDRAYDYLPLSNKHAERVHKLSLVAHRSAAIPPLPVSQRTKVSVFRFDELEDLLDIIAAGPIDQAVVVASDTPRRDQLEDVLGMEQLYIEEPRSSTNCPFLAVGMTD